VASSCEYHYKPLNSIIITEYLEQLRYYELLRKDSVHQSRDLISSLCTLRYALPFRVLFYHLIQCRLNQWFSTGAMPCFGGATGKSRKNGRPWKLLSGPRKFYFYNTIKLLISILNALSFLQLFIRTNWHCLGTFKAGNFSVSPCKI
jgi:hypothetical protein